MHAQRLFFFTLIATGTFSATDSPKRHFHALLQLQHEHLLTELFLRK
jgi:hypothetical protein